VNCRSNPKGAAAAEPASPLTDRESDILLLAALGYSDRQIAGLMRVSIGSIDRHRHELCRKLGLGAADGLGAALALALLRGADDDAAGTGRRPAETLRDRQACAAPGGRS
jgi:DNA-binding NarL/FixJ family response regulator